MDSCCSFSKSYNKSSVSPTHLVVRARLSERVDGHADARGGEDVEVDLEARERLEEVEGRALVGALVRSHLLELLADPHDLVLHRRRHDDGRTSQERLLSATSDRMMRVAKTPSKPKQLTGKGIVVRLKSGSAGARLLGSISCCRASAAGSSLRGCELISSIFAISLKYKIWAPQNENNKICMNF